MLKSLKRLSCVLLLAAHAGPLRGQEPTDNHLAAGNPSGAVSDPAKPDNYLLVKPQYALSYNNAHGTPNWVSWRLSRKWTGKARRSNAFAPEAGLPRNFMSVRPNDYRASGFDRGHMCPSGDRSVTKEDQDVTFSMANMVPQAPGLNRETWEGLEAYCRRQSSARQGTLYRGRAVRPGRLGREGI
jgi:endonuclease G